MATEDKQMNRVVPLQLVIIIAVLVFVGGAVAGILFCGHYAHELLAPVSGVTISEGDTGQIKALEAEVKKYPANVSAWIELGNLYFDIDQYEKALAAYNHSLQLDPKNADVWTDLGIMYRRSGRPEKAVEAFDRAIAEDPKHENARLNKGIVLMYDLKDSEGAIRAWEALLEVNPDAMAREDQSVLELVLQYKMEGQSPAKQSGQ